MYDPRAPSDLDMHGSGGEGSRPPKRPRGGWPPPPDDMYQDNFHHGPPQDAPENSRISRQDVPAHKTPDKERGRLLSCRECRRLKLKCDRVFPCQSCRKRGCSDICPEGALTSGRGSRFILANTEQLHERITQLSDRVRQLEDGLQTLQASYSNEPHPLLTPDLLRIKNSQLRQSPTTETHSRDDTPKNPVDFPNALRKPEDYSMDRPNLIPYGTLAIVPDINIPSDILHLSVAFPFPWTVDIGVRKRIRDCLPPIEETRRLCEQACRNALWQYNLDASESFLQNLIHHCYASSIEDLGPRRLALLLMILSIGSLVDLHKPLGSLHGEAYHHLARAAVCEIPLMEEPDFDELHALFFMVWYHLVFSDNKKAVGYAWNLLGFIAKLAQGLGLHRDGSRLKVIPEEEDKRRFLFWELLNLDCRLSLSLGRPPSISLAHVDVKRPNYHAKGLSVSREEILYHEWKNAFFIECLTPILEAMISITPPDYSHIITLDRAVRTFGVPPLLDESSIVNAVKTRLLSMQRAFVATSRDIALLQLHRRYFTDAMNNCPEPFDFHHRFAPSVVATYLGASSLISTVTKLYDQEQHLSTRFLCFWFNAFSAAVTLTLFISRAPSSPLATFALQDLERVRQLFMHAATILPFSAKALPLMEKMGEKSRHLHMQVRRNSLQDGSIESAMMDTSKVPGASNVVLPPSFTDAHPSLCQYAEQIMSTPVSPVSRMYVSHPQNVEDERTWLPEVYRFQSAGITVDDRYNFASAPPTPFSPSDPRVGKHETVNFDHGAITVDLSDTSYMAWF
ncbi:uncharacterized protein EV420DRAFT_1627400 [Desarmillaria tabescens]|uniref:Zn(2)-C6 fungal-type domain-containing protein n=1 Tax=Armillaria tabescens TaxID=1929756 RepID=A0AA39TV83_ARMTA|nr:uncharacterized protein EV420DRAFT_1627400 [Desarmillaria tabescens]KAK0464414.1 hypothetical protein EV420DRAFT_1627400 [Desarmillaria tabescens]